MSRLPTLFAVPEAMTRRLAAVVLLSQVPVIVFAGVGARGLADSVGDSSATRYHLLGYLLAGLAVLAAALLRTRLGLALGWLVQLLSLASAVIVPVMLVVGLLFLVLWITALVQGVKMDALTRRYLAEHADSQANSA